jgi:hypothetical protein
MVLIDVNVLFVVNYILGLIMVSGLCDGINAIAGKAQNQ